MVIFAASADICSRKPFCDLKDKFVSVRVRRVFSVASNLGKQRFCLLRFGIKCLPRKLSGIRYRDVVAFPANRGD